MYSSRQKGRIRQQLGLPVNASTEDVLRVIEQLQLNVDMGNKTLTDKLCACREEHDLFKRMLDKTIEALGGEDELRARKETVADAAQRVRALADRAEQADRDKVAFPPAERELPTSERESDVLRRDRETYGILFIRACARIAALANDLEDLRLHSRGQPRRKRLSSCDIVHSMLCELAPLGLGEGDR